MSELGNENNQVPQEQQPVPQQAPVQQPVQSGPLPNAPGAVGSLICGILGFFICGLIFGIIAIVLGNKAKQAIAAQPGEYGGAGMAQAGYIMGIISLVLWAIVVVLQIIIGVAGAAAN